jgi:hypothetical protein
LSLRWESRDHWHSINSALDCEGGSETQAAVAIALHNEAVRDNRWVSYSRNRKHYTMPRRYPAPSNAYDIPGFDRALVKVSFNIMLNSSSRSGSRHTIVHKAEMVRAVLGDDFPGGLQGEDMWYRAAAVHPGFAQTASQQAEQLMDTIMAKHAPISQMFFTGAGLALQRLDSDIAESVMREMRRRGIVVLPVHDSFLAPASKAAELEAIMVEIAAKFGATVFCSRSSTVPTG